MKHFGSDGNGGFLISKPFAAITILLMIIGMVIPIVFGYGGLNQKVELFEERLPIIEDNVQNLELHYAVLDERLTAIDNGIQEIKYEIRKE